MIRTWTFSTLTLGALMALGCANSDGDGDGTGGGVFGTGGVAPGIPGATGGFTSTGGAAPGTGGVAATGGAAAGGTGGVAATGGAAAGGTGGSTGGTGGSTGGTGGSTGGTGGSSGTGSTVFDGDGSWVDGSGNGYGIQGAFFALEDSVKNGSPVNDGLTHTNLTPDVFGEGIDPCVSGTVAKVTNSSGGDCDPQGSDCEWTAIWGGGIGLNLNETGGEASTKLSYDASAEGVTGFTFKISGNVDGATIRFKAKQTGSGDDFCSEVAIGTSSVDLSELEHNCYEGGVQSKTLDVSKLESLQWQIVSSHETSYSVSNFCVESLSVY